MVKRHQLYKEILDITSSEDKPDDKTHLINNYINKHDVRMFCVGAGWMLLFMALCKSVLLLFI